jgi:hypothetical protein
MRLDEHTRPVMGYSTKIRERPDPGIEQVPWTAIVTGYVELF